MGQATPGLFTGGHGPTLPHGLRAVHGGAEVGGAR